MPRDYDAASPHPGRLGYAQLLAVLDEEIDLEEAIVTTAAITVASSGGSDPGSAGTNG